MISVSEFSLIFQSAVRSGSEKAMSENGLLKDRLSNSEAYRLYGRENVSRWIKEGLVNTQVSSANTRRTTISRTEIEAVASKSNRISYLPVAER